MKSLLFFRTTFVFSLFHFFIIYLFLPNTLFAEDVRKNADESFYAEQYEKAISLYLTALENDKTNQDILFRVGLCYYLAKQNDKATEYWLKGKNINPDFFKNRIFRVPAGSMKPTLLVGDHVIVDLEYYKKREVKRGDIVVFKYPLDREIIFIKRVIGLPLEKVLLKDKMVYINDQLYENKACIFSDPRVIDGKLRPRDNYGPLDIADNEYFVLGDNRDESFDSRSYGCVKKELIIGKPVVIYFSSPDKNINNVIPERVGLLIK